MLVLAKPLFLHCQTSSSTTAMRGSGSDITTPNANTPNAKAGDDSFGGGGTGQEQQQQSPGRYPRHHDGSRQGEVSNKTRSFQEARIEEPYKKKCHLYFSPHKTLCCYTHPLLLQVQSQLPRSLLEAPATTERGGGEQRDPQQQQRGTASPSSNSYILATGTATGEQNTNTSTAGPQHYLQQAPLLESTISGLLPSFMASSHYNPRHLLEQEATLGGPRGVQNIASVLSGIPPPQYQQYPVLGDNLAGLLQQQLATIRAQQEYQIALLLRNHSGGGQSLPSFSPNHVLLDTLRGASAAERNESTRMNSALFNATVAEQNLGRSLQASPSSSSHQQINDRANLANTNSSILDTDIYRSFLASASPDIISAYVASIGSGEGGGRTRGLPSLEQIYTSSSSVADHSTTGGGMGLGGRSGGAAGENVALANIFSALNQFPSGKAAASPFPRRDVEGKPSASPDGSSSPAKMPNRDKTDTRKDDQTTSGEETDPQFAEAKLVQGSSAEQESSIIDSDESRCLYLDGDEQYLTEYQCLLRKQLEIFEAVPNDLRGSTQGRNVRIVIGQVGLRCRHCANLPLAARTKGAVYFSQTIAG
jgi:hypothetical protein